MKIIGVSAYYHDSAAALLVDGEIAAAAQEERFTRKKHDAQFPTNALRYCLDVAGCRLGEIDNVVFYEKPFLKFEPSSRHIWLSPRAATGRSPPPCRYG